MCINKVSSLLLMFGLMVFSPTLVTFELLNNYCQGNFWCWKIASHLDLFFY
jgi:hypothetical protein